MPSPLPSLRPPDPLVQIVREYPALRAYYDGLSRVLGDMADAIGFTPSVQQLPGFMARWNELVGELSRLAGYMRTIEGTIQSGINKAIAEGWMTADDAREYWASREPLSGLGLGPAVVIIIAIAIITIGVVAAVLGSTWITTRELTRRVVLLYTYQLEYWRNAIASGLIPATTRMPSPPPTGGPSGGGSWADPIVAGSVGIASLAVVGLALWAFAGRSRK